MSTRSRSIDFRIGHPQILLLKAAFAAKEEGAAALAAWWRDIPDFDAVRGTDAALFPRIYANLGSHIRDRTLAARMKGVARHHWLKNQYLVTTCGEVLSHLDQAGIPVLLMKGAAIAATGDEPGLRTMSDCDLLVPKEQALDALRALRAAKPLEKVNVVDQDLEIAHAATLQLHGNRHATFDIHWRPLQAIGAPELSREMFARARRVEFAGRPCLAPCPEHLVFHAIVHGVHWSIHARYDWLIDTINVLSRAGDTFDWRELATIARRYGFGYLVGSALAAAQVYADIPVPGEVLRRLKGRLAPLERLEMSARLSKPSGYSQATEVLLAVQQRRRNSMERLRQSPLRALPAVLQSLYGSRSGGRSFIDNDRKDRITFLQGWSAPEALGRWTEGRQVTFAIYAPERPQPTHLMIRASALAVPGMPGQKVDVFAGLKRLKRLTWPRSEMGGRVRTIKLPSSIWRGDTAVLRLSIDRPMTPMEAGISGDTRALGLFVRHLSVDPPARDAVRSPLDLSAGGSVLDAMWQGWAAPEPKGCWTVGNRAWLIWRASQPIPAGSRVLIDIDDIAPGREAIKGSVALNDVPPQRFSRRPEEGAFVVELPLADGVSAGAEMSIRLQIENPRAPVQSGGKDRRPLGLSVRTVSVAPPA